MEKRSYSIDFLRGIAIVGMVFSGQIFWNADLPAWLFHAQVPPPSFRFDPAIPGITWVDLVFPFFLFSMGAAISLSLRKRLEHHFPMRMIIKSVCMRWAFLVLFAISLENLSGSGVEHFPAWAAALIKLTGWGCFCAMFMRIGCFSRAQNRGLMIAGTVSLIALLLFCRVVCGYHVSVMRNNVIIFVLGNMALFGSLVWLATRNNVPMRLAVLAFLVAMQLGSKVEGSWNQALWFGSPYPWLIRFDALKYLCIVIPGTIVGDCIYGWLQKQSLGVPRKMQRYGAWIIFFSVLLVCVNVWGLFTRHLLVNLVVSVLICWVISKVLRNKEADNVVGLYVSFFNWGTLWLMLGLVLEAFEGGIKKDHPTLSYFFVTSGLASFVLLAVEIAMRQFAMRFRVLVGCGQNPMIAYTAAAYLLFPVLTLLHLDSFRISFGLLHPWMGVVHGVVVSTAVVAVTVFFTKRSLFWRT